MITEQHCEMVTLNGIRGELGLPAVQNLLNAEGNTFTAVANTPNVYSNGKFIFMVELKLSKTVLYLQSFSFSY